MKTNKMILTIMLVFTLIAFAGEAVAAEEWITKTPMPTARHNLHAVSIGGLLYVAGGHDGSGATNKLEAYDPATDAWVAKAPMPGAVYQGSVGVIDNRLYVAGGWNWPLSGIPIRTLQIYDLATNSWSSGADMPILSGCSVAGVINRKLYVLTACDGYSGFRKYLHVYDPDSNSWVEKAQAPNIHDEGAGGVINGKFYVVGGFDGSSISATLDVYDPATDTWATKAPMPTARRNLAAGVINGKLYVVGGSDSTGTSAALEVYDPATDSWVAKAPMSGARISLAVGVIEDKLYAVGGSADNAASPKLEVFSSISATLTPTPIATSTPTTPVPTTTTPAPTTPVPTVTTQAPTAITPAPTPAKFRVAPTAVLRPVTSVIEREQDGIVELYMDNPSLNDITLRVEARVNVPSGIHVYGQSFGSAGAAGMVMGSFEIPPGTARTIAIVIKADKTARIGSHSIQFVGLYYPGENKDYYQPISLTYPLTVKQASKKPDDPKPSQGVPEGAEAPGTPGFGIVLAVVSIFGIARLLRRL